MDKPATRNIRLTLRFDGTAYHGWQVQRNARTVQQTLQDALEALLGERPGVTGCSRTDAGVHAAEYVCNFRTALAVPCEGLRKGLNARLPQDIAATACGEVPDAFHARYSARGKEYVYRLFAQETRDPFLLRYALHYPYPVRPDVMEREAQAFLGTHDFTSFCASGGSVEDKVRTVSLFELTQHDGLVLFRVRADGFLYNMVRIMVGTLLAASRGKIGPEGVAGVLAAKDRAAAGETVPPNGLCLTRVFYGEEGTP